VDPQPFRRSRESAGCEFKLRETELCPPYSDLEYFVSHASYDGTVLRGCRRIRRPGPIVCTGARPSKHQSFCRRTHSSLRGCSIARLSTDSACHARASVSIHTKRLGSTPARLQAKSRRAGWHL